jgi:hypothetical protein
MILDITAFLLIIKFFRDPTYITITDRSGIIAVTGNNPDKPVMASCIPRESRCRLVDICVLRFASRSMPADTQYYGALAGSLV